MEVELICKIGTQEVFITIQGREDEITELIEIIQSKGVIEDTHIRPDNLKKQIKDGWLG